MQLDPIGVGIGAALLLLGYFLRAPIIAALFMSMAFGSTAIVILPMLGGASPLLYTFLAVLLIASTLCVRRSRAGLARVFSQHWVPAVIAILLVYTVAGAFIMPRLFAGQTTMFVPVLGRIVEVELSPVSGNLTQSCYFAISVFVFFSLSVLLVREEYFRAVRTAFFAFVTLHASLGLVDLAGKLAGGSDILSPIRTASYTMLVESKVEGFWRIVGGYPEASSFASVSLVGLAFSFSYWRATGSRFAFALAFTLVVLVLLSTSTTGYVGLAALSAALMISLLRNAVGGRLTSRDLAVLMLAAVTVAMMAAVWLFDERVFDPLTNLIQAMIIDKSASASAEERFYWNYKSFNAFLDTGGLGIGLGSSRASGWMLAVLSQLGVIGTILFSLPILEALKRPYRYGTDRGHEQLAALCTSMRAAALTTLLAAMMSSGGADPGIFFFATFATLLAGKIHLARMAGENRAPHPEARVRTLSYAPQSTVEPFGGIPSVGNRAGR